MLILKGPTYDSAVWSLNFAPDGRTLVSCANDDVVRLWDFAAGNNRVFRTLKNAAAVAFSPDGSEVACRYYNGLILWPLGDGQTWNTRLAWSGSHRVVFSPDGRFLATGGDVPILWNRQTGQAIPTDADGADADGVAFSPDGRTLASAHRFRPRRGEWEHAIRLTDLASTDMRGTLRGHTATASALAYSPNGRLLAATCCQSLWVWDVVRGEPVTQMRFDRQHFQSVAFTPDGRFLGAARNDNTVRFWDTTTWRQHVAFDWDIGPLVSLDIARDGLRAAAGSKRGRIVVWDIDF